jgi:hypothetical protein
LTSKLPSITINLHSIPRLTCMMGSKPWRQSPNQIHSQLSQVYHEAPRSYGHLDGQNDEHTTGLWLGKLMIFRLQQLDDHPKSKGDPNYWRYRGTNMDMEKPMQITTSCIGL